MLQVIDVIDEQPRQGDFAARRRPGRSPAAPPPSCTRRRGAGACCRPATGRSGRATGRPGSPGCGPTAPARSRGSPARQAIWPRTKRWWLFEAESIRWPTTSFFVQRSGEGRCSLSASENPGEDARQRADGKPQAFDGSRHLVHSSPPCVVSCVASSAGSRRSGRPAGRVLRVGRVGLDNRHRRKRDPLGVTTSRTVAHVSQRLRTASSLGGSCLHHAATAKASSSPRCCKARTTFCPALGGVVLVQLPLALEPLDLDAEADDLRQQPVHERTGRVERPRPGHGPLRTRPRVRCTISSRASRSSITSTRP